MHRYFLWLFFLGLTINSLAQAPLTEEDTTTVVLAPVTIRALGGYTTQPTAAGGHARLDARALQEAPSTTLVPALHRIAGVRLEERAPASYRLTIRGSSLRAPFGVRNVKVYWNGLPITEPNNTTPLNLLDLGQVDALEVLKGPSSSSFGAGTGGVLHLTTAVPEPGLGVQVRYTAGSWGTNHLRAQVQGGNVATRWDFRAQHLQSAGYRDHSAVQRTGLQGQVHHTLTSELALRGFLLASDLAYQLPGGLTAEQYTANPRQARPRSAEQNSSVAQRRLWMGLGLQDGQGPWQHHTTAFAYVGDFENPFILDYKQENHRGAGLRSTVQWQPNTKWELQTGLELLTSADSAGNYGNVNGLRDTLRFFDYLTAQQGLAFVAANYSPTAAWQLSGGLSLNGYRYTVHRLQTALGGDATGLMTSAFAPVWAPRAAVRYQLGNWVGHATLSYGFSPPSLDEIRTNEGSLNASLAPEQGINYEVGARWLAEGRERLALNVFYFQLRQTITTYTDPNGVVLFRNAGRTDQWGVELQGHEQWAPGPIAKLAYRYAYTYHHFRYQDYTTGGQDYSGNALPGVAPHTLTHSLTWQHGHWQAYVQHLWGGAQPLNDANTVYTEPFHALSAQVSYRYARAGWIGEAFVGVQNALNQTYGLGHDLNPFGGRYYQASPGRTFLVGITVDWMNTKR